MTAMLGQHSTPWRRFAAQSRGASDRSLSASEVLFLEALRIAIQEEWREFAIGLIRQRLCCQLMALRVVYRAELKTSQARQFSELLKTSIAELRLGTKALRSTLNVSPNAGWGDELLATAEQMLEVFAQYLQPLPPLMAEEVDQYLCKAHRRFVLVGLNRSDRQDTSAAEAQHAAVGSEQRLHENALCGLSLSGGGIRSASFAIGVLQSLAGSGLLPAFNYVSSVSGGGYAASWLAAWAFRHKDGMHGVSEDLNAPAESPPLRWVRRFSSYLAPRLSFAVNSDGPALLAGYIINWVPVLLLLLCFLTWVLLLPHGIVQTARWIAQDGIDAQGRKLLLVGVSVLALLLFMGVVRRLTMFYRVPGDHARHPVGVPSLIVIGSLITSLLLSASMPVLLKIFERIQSIVLLESMDGMPAARYVAMWVVWMVLHIFAVLIGQALGTTVGQDAVDRFRLFFGARLQPAGPLRPQKTPRWRLLAAIVISSMIGAGGMVWAMEWTADASDMDWLITLGPLGVLLVFAGSEIANAALTRHSPRAVDSAWTARVGGWMLSGTLMWTVLCGIAVISGRLLTELHTVEVYFKLGAVGLYVSLLAWIYVGRRTVMLHLVLAISFLALLDYLVVYPLIQAVGPDLFSIWCTFVLAGLATYIVSLVTDVNTFSLHALYKEGLVRTFLGASRVDHRARAAEPSGIDPMAKPQFSIRRPDPITNIDDEDNPALYWLTSKKNRKLPVLLLNAAVNGRSRTDMDGRVPRAWPYTFSQYYCGSPAAGVGYSKTEKFFRSRGGRGLTLGTAMAVSGAAMSPTSGHHTHPLRAFVFGLLNARLGLWIGNPSFPNKVGEERPSLTGWTILAEVLGFRAWFSRWIHLSDGGHFENLGVFELVRRGCSRIVAVDASCDPGVEFQDLANVIRRARIDLGVNIVRDETWEIPSPTSNGRGRTKGALMRDQAWAWFTIDYGNGLPLGRLLYIKPMVRDEPGLPIEILQYWRTSPTFPHETTADQFFTEAQMEAYRSLGHKCGREAIGRATKITEHPDLNFDKGLSDFIMRVFKARLRAQHTP